MADKIEVPPINYRTYIEKPPEVVYETITTASGWDAWFTQGMEIDAKAGGRIMFRWKDWGADRYTCDAEGPVLEADAPKRFVFQWTPGDSTTTIEFDLKPQGSGTKRAAVSSGRSK